MSKTFKIVGNDMSDGYHTFDELYDHRIELFLALVKVSGFPCQYLLEHYPGWDVVFLQLPTGQISYHVPSRCRDFLSKNGVEIHRSSWDGHDSATVLSRLAQLQVLE